MKPEVSPAYMVRRTCLAPAEQAGVPFDRSQVEPPLTGRGDGGAGRAGLHRVGSDVKPWACAGLDCPRRKPISAATAPTCYTCGRPMTELAPADAVGRIMADAVRDNPPRTTEPKWSNIQFTLPRENAKPINFGGAISGGRIVVRKFSDIFDDVEREFKDRYQGKAWIVNCHYSGGRDWFLIEYSGSAPKDEVEAIVRKYVNVGTVVEVRVR